MNLKFIKSISRLCDSADIPEWASRGVYGIKVFPHGKLMFIGRGDGVSGRFLRIKFTDEGIRVTYPGWSGQRTDYGNALDGNVFKDLKSLFDAVINVHGKEDTLADSSIYFGGAILQNSGVDGKTKLIDPNLYVKVTGDGTEELTRINKAAWNIGGMLYKLEDIDGEEAVFSPYVDGIDF